MKSVIASLIAVAGMSAAAHGQLMQMLVSTDGVNFSSSVNAAPGDTVQVLVTASLTISQSTVVAGFGSANFQPTVSNWHAGDTLLPLRQGGNTLPADGSGMVQPQFYTGQTAGSGPHVQAGYAGGYGRVMPMGRTFLDGANALTGFVHNNPDGSGNTYLRIAQGNVPMWIGQPGNTSGGSGVNAAQLFVVGRTASDPDFWGNVETLNDPLFGWGTSPVDANNNYRRQNVELFRFAFTLGSGDTGDMIVDAPIAGQQADSSGTRYMGFYTGAGQSDPGLHTAVSVQSGTVHIVPTPASIALLGLGGLVVGRRRRA